MYRFITAGMIICFAVFSAVQTGAEASKTKVYQQLKLTKSEYKGKCSKHSVFKGVMDQELFYIMDCPVCYPGRLQIQEYKKSDNAGKGSIVYGFKCLIESTDFYSGDPGKIRKKKDIGRVTADYIDVFDELTFINIRVTGPKACAWPIINKMNALMKKSKFRPVIPQ